MSDLYSTCFFSIQVLGAIEIVGKNTVNCHELSTILENQHELSKFHKTII